MRAFTLRVTGQTWSLVDKFPLGDVADLYYDAHRDKVLVSSKSSDMIYSIDPTSLTWKWTRTGYRIRLVRADGERLLAASLYDGVLIEPQTVEVGQR